MVRLRESPQRDQEAEEQHREAEVSGDEHRVQAVLDGEATERRLREDESSGRRGAAHEPAVVTKATESDDRKRRDQHDDDRGGGSVAELDQRVLVKKRENPPSAKRPALASAAGGATTQPGIAHANDPADHDQPEGREDGGVEQAAEAGEVARFATRRSEAHRGQATGAPPGASPPAARGSGLRDPGASASGFVAAARFPASAGARGRQASVRSRIALRMSYNGSALRTSGTASKLCAGGGERANHSSVAPPQGSCPARTPPRRLYAALASSRRIPAPITNAPIEATRLYPSSPWPPKNL